LKAEKKAEKRAEGAVVVVVSLAWSWKAGKLESFVELLEVGGI